MEQLHKKTKANAVSSYLLLWINWAFLFNKDNPYIHNNFVKSHTKTALLIHLWLLLNLVIFVWNNPLPIFPILGYNLWDIISIILFLVLTSFIFTGIYRANRWEYFWSKDIIKFSKDTQLLDINNDIKINERDKLTIILAHIPFLWAYLYGKYAKYQVIQNIGKLNMYITSIILLLYISHNQNLANIFLLGYIVYIVFSGINLFTHGSLLQIRWDFLPTPWDARIHMYTLLQYLKNYFSKAKFIPYKKLHKNILDQNIWANKQLEKTLQSLPKENILKKYNIYIKSYIILSILTIWVIFSGISNRYLILLFLIALSTAGYIKYSLSYQTPFIYDLYHMTEKIFIQIKSFFIKTKKLHEKEEIKTMKVSGK